MKKFVSTFLPVCILTFLTTGCMPNVALSLFQDTSKSAQENSEFSKQSFDGCHGMADGTKSGDSLSISLSREVAKKYREELARSGEVLSSSDTEDDYKIEVPILNDLTDYLLQNPSPTKEEFRDYKNQLYCRVFYDQYRVQQKHHLRTLQELKEEHEKQRLQIRKEHKGSFPDQDLKECDHLYFDRRQNMMEDQSLDLDRIAQKIKDRGGNAPSATDKNVVSKQNFDELPAIQPTAAQNGHNPYVTYDQLSPVEDTSFG